MNDVIEFLQQFISNNGFEVLSRDPFSVYEAMDGVDPRTARLLLITMMSKTHEMARKGCSEDELVRYIQSEHSVDKKTARKLASMYLEVFSDENRKSWNEAKEAGFRKFCEKEWSLEWQGSCDWHSKHGGSYPCSAEASLTFTVQNRKKLRSHFSTALASNPFLSADDLFRILAKQMEADLDRDLDEYCNADDYYEPYLEEFVGDGTYDSEEKWKSWGLDLMDFTGSGDIDFDP